MNSSRTDTVAEPVGSDGGGLDLSGTEMGSSGGLSAGFLLNRFLSDAGRVSENH